MRSKIRLRNLSIRPAHRRSFTAAGRIDRPAAAPFSGEHKQARDLNECTNRQIAERPIGMVDYSATRQRLTRDDRGAARAAPRAAGGPGASPTAAGGSFPCSCACLCSSKNGEKAGRSILPAFFNSHPETPQNGCEREKRHRRIALDERSRSKSMLDTVEKAPNWRSPWTMALREGAIHPGESGSSTAARARANHRSCPLARHHG